MALRLSEAAKIDKASSRQALAGIFDGGRRASSFRVSGTDAQKWRSLRDDDILEYCFCCCRSACLQAVAIGIKLMAISSNAMIALANGNISPAVNLAGYTPESESDPLPWLTHRLQILHRDRQNVPSSLHLFAPMRTGGCHGVQLCRVIAGYILGSVRQFVNP